ncbi:MAG: ABC transporter ATP-binding protein [Clostridia bacterium]|nr:ABC transporter ATP-binding protein [Clostridia bacterium]
MIRLENVTKKYTNGETELYALNNISLEIKTGEFVAITGKSGSGKSTLLNIIGTLDTASEGKIYIDDVNIADMNDKQLAAFRRENLGFIFQSFHLEEEYTVSENVEIPLILSGKFHNKDLIESALKEVDIAHKSRVKVKNLSGGEKQRVAIARAIINNPSYILADEPCGNLDSANSENIISLLTKLHKSGKTIIMVTHDKTDALKAQRLIAIGDGKIINDESITPC